MSSDERSQGEGIRDQLGKGCVSIRFVFPMTLWCRYITGYEDCHGLAGRQCFKGTEEGR